MRHQRHKNSLGLTVSHRKAVLNNMARNLIINNRIKTTHKKAKAASQFIDKLITLAKRKDLHAQRQLFASLKSRSLVKNIVNEIAPRFANREGGYTRILKYKKRVGDGAQMAILEFTEIPLKDLTKEKKAKKSKKKKTDDSEQAKSDVKKPKKTQTSKDDKDTANDVAEPEKDDKKSGFFDNLRGYLKK